MKELPSISQLIEAFTFFPSIGEKTAERMAYSILDMNEEKIKIIVKAIEEARSRIKTCANCGALIDSSSCPFCEDTNRNHSICLIVPFAKDIFPFEKTNAFKGTYHVLNGEISSIKGITLENLNIKSLEKRIEKEKIEELIIATNSTLEGETTALYLYKLFEDYNIKITRLARGLPMGGQLEYSDELTLIKALEGRRGI